MLTNRDAPPRGRGFPEIALDDIGDNSKLGLLLQNIGQTPNNPVLLGVTPDGDQAIGILSDEDADNLVDVATQLFVRELDLTGFLEIPEMDHPAAGFLRDLLLQWPVGEDSNMFVFFNRIFPGEEDGSEILARFCAFATDVLTEATMDGIKASHAPGPVRGVRTPSLTERIVRIFRSYPFGESFDRLANDVHQSPIDDDARREVIEFAFENEFGFDTGAWAQALQDVQANSQ